MGLTRYEAILGMIRHEICPADSTKVDYYDGEKLLYCEQNKMEYYKA